MKNIFILLIVALAFSFTSCDKEKADKDVENSIKQMELFNKTYAEFMEDGVIEAPNEEKDSEYDKLKKMASQYYETINKINKNIKAEKEDAAEGKKIHGYEDAYNKALEDNKAKIEEQSALFIENIEKMQE